MIRERPLLSSKRLLAVIGVAIVLVLMVARATMADDVELQTGAAFRRTLAQPIDAVSWKGVTLRQSLERIRQSQRIAVMLDRNVDPDQSVEFSAKHIPLSAMIEQLAGKYSAGTCRVGPVVYVGPHETTHLLSTVVEMRREEVRKLPADRQRQLLRATPWRWERLSNPRDLLKELEADYRVRILGKENMPHDLWPAMQLPKMNFAEKLSLVLAGFHVTFKISPDGSAVQIVAMPKEASLSRKYSAGDSAAGTAEQLSKQFPEATIRAQGRELVVDGRWEVHDAIGRLFSGERARPPAREAGKKVYTLTVENKPVGGVVKALGRQLEKEVVFDVSVERRLTQECSLSIKDATLQRLLREILTPAALKFEIDGDTIRVFD